VRRIKFFLCSAIGPIALLTVTLGALVGSSPTAHAYGMATHAWLADEAADRLAQADPSLAFLAADPDAKACFRYGAMFPDVRSVVRQQHTFANLKQDLESLPLIDHVNLSVAGAQAAFATFNTHDSRFALHFIDQAQQSGDRYQLAFALGNLAHILQDKHSQVVLVPTLCQETHCGDLGVEPTEDPSAASRWYPGYENELVIEGFGDLARPHAAVEFLRDAPYRLHPNATVSHQRALVLRRAYHAAASSFVVSLGGTPPTEAGILNGAQILEASATVYPIFTGHFPLTDTMDLFLFRYVRLSWWAQLAHGVANQVTQNLTSSRTLLDLIAPLIPMSAVGSQIGGQNPLVEIMFAYGQGPSEQQRIDSVYHSNAEYQRLRQSGLLNRQIYQNLEYEPAHYMTVAGCTQLTRSAFTDDDLWPVYSRRVMRAAAVRSLLSRPGGLGAANAPELLIYDLRYNASGGTTLSHVAVPGDVGQNVEVEVELFGATFSPEPRLVQVQVRADTGAGSLDPIVAEHTQLIPASALDLREYSHNPRPVITVGWTFRDIPSARGLYVEVSERQLSVFSDPQASDVLLTTELSGLAPMMAGPHYSAHYATYSSELGSLPIRR
jgi:hypothetical protein